MHRSQQLCPGETDHSGMLQLCRKPKSKPGLFAGQGPAIQKSEKETLESCPVISQPPTRQYTPFQCLEAASLWALGDNQTRSYLSSWGLHPLNPTARTQSVGCSPWAQTLTSASTLYCCRPHVEPPTYSLPVVAALKFRGCSHASCRAVHTSHGFGVEHGASPERPATIPLAQVEEC